MVFDSEVVFYNAEERKYNPKTHKYEGGPKEVGRVYANVTDVGTNRSVQILGNLNANDKVIRTYDEPPAKWDYCLINGHVTRYEITTRRDNLKLITLVVGENNG